MQLKDLIGLLRENEPVLHDPEGLTAGIMEAIRSRPASVGERWLRITERMLAAASLALLLSFGVEQFTIVAEVRDLEKQIARSGKSARMHISRIQASELATLIPFIPTGETQRLISCLKHKTPFRPMVLKQVKTISK